nr:unknown [Schistosoma japonicum]
MIALLLVLIHSSIQSGFRNGVSTSLLKQISGVQDHINLYTKYLVKSYEYLEIITEGLKKRYPGKKETIERYVSCLKRNRSETFPEDFFRGMDLLKEEIKENYQNFPREVIENFEQCTASQKQYFIKLQSKGRPMTCDLPNSISAKDRNSLDSHIQSQQKAILFINVLAAKFTLFSNAAKIQQNKVLG